MVLILIIMETVVNFQKYVIPYVVMGYLKNIIDVYDLFYINSSKEFN